MPGFENPSAQYYVVPDLVLLTPDGAEITELTNATLLKILITVMVQLLQPTLETE